MNTYDRGDTVVCRAVIRDRDGQAIDPATLVFKFRAPDGTITTRTYPTAITQVAPGIYESDIACALHGAYKYRWQATGNVVAAQESQLYVARSDLAG